MLNQPDWSPHGVRFYDKLSGRDMVLVDKNEPRVALHGWLMYRHPDGRWVTLRRATEADVETVVAARAREIAAKSAESEV